MKKSCSNSCHGLFGMVVGRPLLAPLTTRPWQTGCTCRGWCRTRRPVNLTYHNIGVCWRHWESDISIVGIPFLKLIVWTRFLRSKRVFGTHFLGSQAPKSQGNPRLEPRIYLFFYFLLFFLKNLPGSSRDFRNFFRWYLWNHKEIDVKFTSRFISADLSGLEDAAAGLRADALPPARATHGARPRVHLHGDGAGAGAGAAR